MKIRFHKTWMICLAAALMLMGCSKGPDKYELRDQGVALFQQGNYQAALEKFDAALDASKGQVSDLQFDILKYSAECRLHLGDYEAAKASYEALIELDADDKEAQAQYAALMSEMDAIDVCRKTKAMIEAGEYEEADKILEDYASLDGTISGRTAWFDRAVCAEHMQKYADAAELLEQYLKVYPDDEAARKEYDFCSTR